MIILIFNEKVKNILEKKKRGKNSEGKKRGPGYEVNPELQLISKKIVIILFCIDVYSAKLEKYFGNIIFEFF